VLNCTESPAYTDGTKVFAGLDDDPAWLEITNKTVGCGPTWFVNLETELATTILLPGIWCIVCNPPLLANSSIDPPAAADTLIAAQLGTAMMHMPGMPQKEEKKILHLSASI